MKLLVVLPHTDPTLRPQAPEGWTLHDAGAAFAGRARDPGALRSSANESEREGTSESLRRALLARTAAALFERGEASDVEGHLRALGAAFTGLSSDRVALRLDDLELHGGSTERSLDVLSVSREPLPYSPELQAAIEVAREAERVRLWVDRDQQLPAVFAFAQALGRPEALELDGPFARRHAEALTHALPELRTCASEPLGCTFEIIGASETLVWREESGTAIPERAWAGHLSLTEALAEIGDRLLFRAGSVGLAALVGDQVIGADGSVHPLSRVRSSFVALAEAGVQLGLEWWVGAPGQTAEVHEATLAALDAGVLAPARLVGLRPFHWSKHRPPERFAGRAVELDAPETDRDLARSYPFRCEGTLSPAEKLTLIESLAAKALAKHPLVPGRVALACVAPPRVLPSRAESLRLAADCAVVELAAGLDGKPQTSWYAVQLATRATLAMDPRIAPQLAAWTTAMRPETALPKLPAAVRERLVQQLIDKRILEGVAS